MKRNIFLIEKNMKKGINFIAAAFMGAAAVACSSPAKMAEMAENVKVSSDPEVLEVVAGNIDANVTVTYPADYFHPKAVLEVTPVLVYDGGEAEFHPYMFQGEKVKDNYTVVSSKGQTVTRPVRFEYVEGMENAHLELRGAVSYKGKTYELPVKKVAVGCNTTYMLAETRGKVSLKADNYQEAIAQSAEGQIMYGINSADVANKQLKSQSIKDFQEALDAIKANDRMTIKNTEVIAYASPDGGEKLNSKLSDKRSKTGEKAFEKVVKGKDIEAPEVKSVGQDWEGFQELVAKSDIQDKDLIIRVLSMYSDPAVRESEIKNISEVYTSLKGSVLPALRRARFIANVEFQNYSSEELLDLVEKNSDVLDEPALLRAATLVKDLSDKVSLYKKAISKYDSDVARFNLGATYLNAGKTADAKAALASVKTKDADLTNALGVVALQEGNLEEAAKLFAKAGTEDSVENAAVVDILNGNYSAAAQKLDGKTGFNAALAQLLNNNLGKAEKALTCSCPRSSYLRAVIAARKGDAEGVAENIEKATKLNSLAARYANDIEFAEYR